MPGEQHPLAVKTMFFFYDILNLMLLLIAGRWSIFHFLPYTEKCNDALARYCSCTGERSVNTYRYFNRMHQLDLNGNSCRKR
jgi:hypothetical protein